MPGGHHEGFQRSAVNSPSTYPPTDLAGWRREPELLGRHQQILDRAPQAEVELAPIVGGDRLRAGEIGPDLDLVLLDAEAPRLGVPGGRSQDRVAEQEAKLLLDRVDVWEVLDRRPADAACYSRLPGGLAQSCRRGRETGLK